MKLSAGSLREGIRLMLELKLDHEMLDITGASFIAPHLDPRDLAKQVVFIIQRVFHYHPKPQQVQEIEEWLGVEFTPDEMKRFNSYSRDSKDSLVLAIASEYMHRYIRRRMF